MAEISVEQVTAHADLLRIPYAAASLQISKGSDCQDDNNECQKCHIFLLHHL